MIKRFDGGGVLPLKFNDRELNEQIALGQLTLEAATELRKFGILNMGSGFYAGYTLMYSKTTRQEYPDGNPKDSIGSAKLPMSIVPETFIAVTALGLLEGREKYGYVNWRAAEVRASIYLDALRRHIAKWIEGEECDPITKVPHLGNAAACIAILVDAQVQGTLIDDRPMNRNPGKISEYIDSLSDTVKHLKELFKDKHPTDWTQTKWKETQNEALTPDPTMQSR